MKQKTILICLSIMAILISFTLAAADGYPVPNYYPIGQQPSPYYYGNPYPYQQQYYYIQPTATPNPTPTPQPYYPPQQQYYYPQQQYPFYNEGQPYYDPYSQRYFYPIGQNQPPAQPIPQQPYYYPQPVQPFGTQQQEANVQISEQWSSNGTINLTWTIRNITREDWSRSNIDIKCIGGCELLSKQSKTLWDIPYTVKRNGMLSFTVNIRQPYPGQRMTFAMVAGSKTLYTFNVFP